MAEKGIWGNMRWDGESGVQMGGKMIESGGRKEISKML